MIGVPVNAILQHVTRHNEYCIVLRAKKTPLVLYKGEALTLSLAAAKAAGKEKSGGFAGPEFWKYENKSLQKKSTTFRKISSPTITNTHHNPTRLALPRAARPNPSF